MRHAFRAALAAVAAIAAQHFAATPSQAQSSPSAFTSATRYDIERRVVGTIAPDPDGTGPLKYAAVRNTYNARGELTKVEKGELAAWKSEAVAPSAWGADFSVLQTLDTDYDSMGRKVKEVAAAGPAATVTQYSYDIAGRLECTAVRMNPAVFSSLPASACILSTAGPNGPDRIRKNVYDAAGQLLQVREGVGTSIEVAEATYGYTPSGKQEYVIDAGGAKAQFVYDGHDRLEKWFFPSTARPAAYNDATQTTALASAGNVNTGDYEQYGYDAGGNRTSLRKRDGSTLTYSYDALNRMTLKTVPERAGLASIYTRDVYYAYDLRGLHTRIRFDSLTGSGLTIGHDGFGRLTANVANLSSASLTLAYQFDADGNRTRITHPDAVYFTTGYDGLGRASSGSWTKSGVTTPFLAITYNAAGLRSDISRGGAGTTYGYDGLARLTSLAQRFLGNAGNAAVTLAYNPAGQIASETRDNDAFAWTGSVAASRDYNVNGLNQYIAVGPASFCYDLNGNLTADGASVYLYDVENRLVEKRAQTSAACPTATAGYTGALQARLLYDPLGRLAETSVDGTTGIRRFLHDGDEIAAEYDGSGAMARRFVWGPGIDEPVIEDAGAALSCTGGATRFLHADQRGSIIAAADCAGNRSSINTYDEYGIPGSANSGRFQYTGQAWTPELQAYYYKARMYDPREGRFYQPDPIGYDDQINLYAYVKNDPVNMADPTGEAIDTIADVIFIGADFADIRSNGLNWTNGISLGANILGAAIPGLTGLGSGTRVAGKVINSGADSANSQRATTLAPGRNSRESVPTQGRRPSEAERREVDRIGNRDGCHTCGARESGNKSGRWTPDHQPPTGRNSHGESQRLHPHCRTCSNRQGGEVARENRRNPPPPPRPGKWHDID